MWGLCHRGNSLSDLGHSKELVHPFRAVLIWEEIKIWSKYRLLNPNAETSYPIPVRISTTARESEKRPDIFAKGRWSLVQDQRLAPNSSIRPMTALHCPKIINKTWIACRRHVWLQLTFYTKTCWNIWFEWLNITRCIFCCSLCFSTSLARYQPCLWVPSRSQTRTTTGAIFHIDAELALKRRIDQRGLSCWIQDDTKAELTTLMGQQVAYLIWGRISGNGKRKGKT